MAQPRVERVTGSAAAGRGQGQGERGAPAIPRRRDVWRHGHGAAVSKTGPAQLRANSVTQAGADDRVPDSYGDQNCNRCRFCSASGGIVPDAGYGVSVRVCSGAPGRNGTGWPSTQARCIVAEERRQRMRALARWACAGCRPPRGPARRPCARRARSAASALAACRHRPAAGPPACSATDGAVGRPAASGCWICARLNSPHVRPSSDRPSSVSSTIAASTAASSSSSHEATRSRAGANGRVGDERPHRALRCAARACSRRTDRATGRRGHERPAPAHHLRAEGAHQAVGHRVRRGTAGPRGLEQPAELGARSPARSSRRRRRASRASSSASVRQRSRNSAVSSSCTSSIWLRRRADRSPSADRG